MQKLLDFRNSKSRLCSAIIPFIDAQTYTGAAVTPQIVITDSETALTENVESASKRASALI
ncbi:MAG: hypothetical protein SPL33_05080 [Fibrobacter sp.]|nr:hypothetical protein [Fibrobacter sp.]MDY6369642.1 hypothetical protein [Fibrobacter sp.]